MSRKFNVSLKTGPKQIISIGLEKSSQDLLRVIQEEFCLPFTPTGHRLVSVGDSDVYVTDEMTISSIPDVCTNIKRCIMLTAKIKLLGRNNCYKN